MAANPTGGWSVDGWRAFWGARSAEAALKRVPTVVTADVEAVWPRVPGRVRGRDEYARRIVDLLALVPDLRLELGEHVTGGEFVFLRWIARGTGPDGPFEGIGTDRLPQARWLAARLGGARPPVALNDADAILHAVAAGLGRSLLPRAVADRDPALRRLDMPGLPDPPTREAWLLTHPDQRRLARVTAVLAWLDRTLAVAGIAR